MTPRLPVVVIGAGPVGLAAAAHLVDRGQEFVVVERGADVGSHVEQWGHVRMFSPWKYNVDPVAAKLLAETGWVEPDADTYPTGNDLRERLLLPLAELPAIAKRIRFSTEVVGVSRVGADRMRSNQRDDLAFAVHLRQSSHLRQSKGEEEVIYARAVLDASGTWSNPRPLGAGGLAAIGERRAQENIHYGIPNLANPEVRADFRGRRVAVVGAGDSAFNTLLDLADKELLEAGTRVFWIIRGGLPVLEKDGDQLPRRGALAAAIAELVDRRAVTVLTDFRIQAVERNSSGLRLVAHDPESASGGNSIEVDEIIGVTGFRPDLEILRELRLDLDPVTEAPQALGPLIDPNVHSCGTVPPHGYQELRHPEQGFFIVGMKSYGRAPTFLLRTGYEQVRSVVAALSGNLEAARNVDLELPETGVCGGVLAVEEAASCG